jgi:hypothetical protein
MNWGNGDQSRRRRPGVCWAGDRAQSRRPSSTPHAACRPAAWSKAPGASEDRPTVPQYQRLWFPEAVQFGGPNGPVPDPTARTPRPAAWGLNAGGGFTCSS